MREDQEEESKEPPRDLREEGGGVMMEILTVVTEKGKLKVSIPLEVGVSRATRRHSVGGRKGKRHRAQLGFTINIIFRVSTDSEQRP